MKLLSSLLGLLLLLGSPVLALESLTEEAPVPLYGHLPYDEAPRESLVAFCEGSSNLIRKDLVPVLKEMIAAAKADGVTLRTISCFRSVRQQDYLFYGIAKKRGQTPEQRARVSAPPGHSEHHTGYAIDFGDANRRSDLEESFAASPAGQWLLANGPRFGFELSFPKGNAQGLSYEPWHWRYVGTAETRAIFAWARKLYPAQPGVPD